MMPHMKSAIIGCLLGTAVGDAMGLPMEGLSRGRQQRVYPAIKGYHLLFGRGMVSDDTEHACMVSQAIIASGGEEKAFAKELAWRMRRWLLALPAGVGFATLRATLKLWMGYPAHRSGVYSAATFLLYTIVGAKMQQGPCRPLCRWIGRDSGLAKLRPHGGPFCRQILISAIGAHRENRRFLMGLSF